MRKKIRRLQRLLYILLACLQSLVVTTGRFCWLALTTGWGELDDRRGVLTVAAHQRLSRRLLAILGITVATMPEQSGIAERGNRLLLSNHLSYLDVLVISSVYPTRFLAKSEVAGWPLIGWLARLGGTIFLERGNVGSSVRGVYQVSRLLRAGHQVHVFPEGTTTNGEALATIHPLFCVAAIRSERPILPLTVRVEEVQEDGQAAERPHEILAWYGEMTFLDHLWRLLLIDAARIQLVTHDELKVGRADRALGLASRLESALSSGLTGGDAYADEENGGADNGLNWSLDLVAGAILFSRFVTPGNQTTQEIFRLSED
jgi:1-acyl-sn-glycerol-3-phosphate acyltransferase